MKVLYAIGLLFVLIEINQSMLLDESCYIDKGGSVLEAIEYRNDLMNNDKCKDVCYLFSYKYSATSEGTKCFCSKRLPTIKASDYLLSCNITCSGSQNESCGGYNLKSYSVKDKRSKRDTFIGCEIRVENFEKGLTEIKNSSDEDEDEDDDDDDECDYFLFRIPGDNFCTREYSNNNTLIVREKCDTNCGNRKSDFCYGYNYRVITVQNITDSFVQNTDDMFFDFVGCFDKIEPNSYVKFSLNLKQCWTFCNYFNFSYIALNNDNKICTCLEDPSMARKKSRNTCSDRCDNYLYSCGSGSRHYSVYQKNDSSDNELPSISKDLTLKTRKCFLRTYHMVDVIYEKNNIDASYCFRFCASLDYEYAILVENFCYCLNSNEDDCVSNCAISKAGYPCYFNIYKLTNSTIPASSSKSKTTAPDNAVSFSVSNLDDVINYIMNVTYDITGCLRNCSQSGWCTIDEDTNKLGCECITGFAGSSCEIDTNKCSTLPCLNNGTCVQNTNTTAGYYCKCDSRYFYGDNCQFEVDICQNVTCENKGICKKNEKTLMPECSCLMYYSGDECQVMSQTLKVIKNVISAASIIAIIILCLFYLMFILCDLVGREERKKRFRMRNF